MLWVILDVNHNQKSQNGSHMVKTNIQQEDNMLKLKIAILCVDSVSDGSHFCDFW